MLTDLPQLTYTSLRVYGGLGEFDPDLPVNDQLQGSASEK
jgi:hypothetical protein